MKRNLATTLGLAMVLLPGVAAALGLGEIEVRSALNQPLQVRIPLRAVQTGDLEGMNVALGTTEQFSRAGLDRPFVLASLRFVVVTSGEGAPYVGVTTREPLVEPFLNFLVEVNWPRGRVIREYTILLDPPLYGDAMSSTVRQAVATAPIPEMPLAEPEPLAEPRSLVQSELPASRRPEPPAPRQPEQPAPSPPAVAAAPPAVAAAAPPRPPVAPAGSYGPVTNTDTLWSLAGRLRPDDSISVQRMMLAILEANPEAFNTPNVNALRAGAVLRIPSRDEIGPDDKAAALLEVKRQYAQWDEYRQQLAGAPAAAPSQASTMVEGAAPTGTTGETESRVEIVSAGTGTQTAGVAAAGGADVKALRDELDLVIEEADRAKQENDELGSRLTEAEQLIADLQRLVELKDDSIATLQRQLAEAETKTAAAATVQTQPEQKVEPKPQAEPKQKAEPKQEAKPKQQKPVVKKPPPSMLDQLRASLPVAPWILGVILGGVLLLGGGVLALLRQKKRAAEAEADAQAEAMGPVDLGESESMISTLGALAEPGKEDDDDITLMPDTPAPDETEEDATEIGTSTLTSEGSGTQTGEDPLAEVNVYLAYERYDQAEELVRDVVERYPDHPEHRLRLLEVFFAAKNVAAFQLAAGELRDLAGEDSPLLGQATLWWQELAPGQDLFGAAVEGAGTGAGDEELFDVTGPAARGTDTVDESGAVMAGEEPGADTGLDFDLGFEMSGPEGAEEPAGSGSLDFDLGTRDAPLEAPESVGEGSGIDFDLGAVEDVTDVPAGSGSSSVDFDLGDEEVGAGEASGSGDGSLDFDLGTVHEVPGPIAGGDSGSVDFELGTDADESAGSSGSDLDFDLDGLGEPGRDVSEETAPLPERVADDHGSGIDFDLGTGVGELGTGPSAAGVGEDEARSDVDFDLGDIDAAPAGEGSALDFDLGGAGGEEAGAAPAGDGSSLDLDFSLDAGDATTEVSDRGAEESLLDFNFGGEGDKEQASSDEGEASGLDLDLGLGAGGEDEVAGAAAQGEASSLDLDLDLGGDETTTLGLGLDSGAGSDDETTATMGAFDTVKLDAATAGTGGLSLEDESLDLDLGMGEDGGEGVAGTEPDTGGDFDIDTQFQGIFGSEGGAAAAGDEASADLDFDLGSVDDSASVPELELPGEESGEEAAPESDESDLETTQFMLRDAPPVGDSGGDAGDDDDEERPTLVLGRGMPGDVDEIQTKLDLAQAYVDMEDLEGARGILGEVMAEGSEAQQEAAKALLQKIS